MSIKFDTSGFAADMQHARAGVESATRPAAQAGAQVLYDEARRIAPRSEHAHWFYGTHQKYLFPAGTLHDSIYQVFSKDNSGQNVATYHVSWNYKKCPYGFMVEFGTSKAPAHSFIRTAVSNVQERSLDAMEKEFWDRLDSALAGQIW